jgi:hypothetical protein
MPGFDSKFWPCCAPKKAFVCAAWSHEKPRSPTMSNARTLNRVVALTYKWHTWNFQNRSCPSTSEIGFVENAVLKFIL